MPGNNCVTGQKCGCSCISWNKPCHAGPNCYRPKNCVIGKPCGRACININYDCDPGPVPPMVLVPPALPPLGLGGATVPPGGGVGSVGGGSVPPPVGGEGGIGAGGGPPGGSAGPGSGSGDSSYTYETVTTDDPLSYDSSGDGSVIPGVPGSVAVADELGDWYSITSSNAPDGSFWSGDWSFNSGSGNTNSTFTCSTLNSSASVGSGVFGSPTGSQASAGGDIFGSLPGSIASGGSDDSALSFASETFGNAQNVALPPLAPGYERNMISHAITRVTGLLGSHLQANPTARVVIASLQTDPLFISGLRIRHALGSGLAVPQWGAYVQGSLRRLMFIHALQQLFNQLENRFPGRVLYGWLNRANANRNNVLVWGANTNNFHGPIGSRIPGGGMASSMGTHGVGVFGIVSTPVGGVPPINDPNATLANLI